MKVGIFGGTFNPIHRSHIYFAKECFTSLGLEKVIMVPTFTPPHKDATCLASSEHRLNMCRLAIEKEPDFLVSSYEIEKGGPSYTWETLEHFRKLYPHWEMYLLMGSDVYLTLLQWKNPGSIFQEATVVGVAREQGEWQNLVAYEKEIISQGARSRLLQIVPHPMSSTEIRYGLKDGESMDQYLEPRVIDYIKGNDLYTRESPL